MADETGYEAESDTESESESDEEAGAEDEGQRPGLEAMAYGDAFAYGRYAPNVGEAPLAHEAWHVTQQGQGYEDESSDEGAEAETGAEPPE